jgi:hypothetical protein
MSKEDFQILLAKSEEQDAVLTKIVDEFKKFIKTNDVYQVPKDVLTEDDFANWINE